MSTAKKNTDEMTFFEHLEVLRWHIVRSIAAIFFFAFIVFLFPEFVFETLLKGPMNPKFWTYDMICNVSERLCFRPEPFDLITRELGEQFIVHLKSSFFLGIICAFPYLIWELWRFIKPALYAGEKKAARGLVLICSGLFITGVLFGYFIIAPFAVSFLSSYTVGAINAPTLSSYVNYMTMFTLPAGLVFELPIIMYFLSKAGIVTPDFLRKYRRHSFVIILIVASIVTPPDIITQFLISVPLYFLYEVSIRISARVHKKQKAVTPA